MHNPEYLWPFVLSGVVAFASALLLVGGWLALALTHWRGGSWWGHWQRVLSWLVGLGVAAGAVVALVQAAT